MSAKEKQQSQKKEPKKTAVISSKKEERKEKKVQKIEKEKLPVSSFKAKYYAEIRPSLMKKSNYKNVMEVPKIVKIVVNRGVGEATDNPKAIEKSVEEISLITSQKPVVTRAKKSIAAFKVRKNVPIGVMVTLRGNNMYSFLEKLVNVVFSRIRDFKGLSLKSFDGRGNFTFGLKEQLVFPEIVYDKVDKTRGMNITITTTAKTDEEARHLFEAFGVPFRVK